MDKERVENLVFALKGLESLLKPKSKEQKLALLLIGKSNHYIKNKRVEGQRRYFKCKCCLKSFDLNNSDDYMGAVAQWIALGEKCYPCGHGLGTKENYPCHITKIK